MNDYKYVVSYISNEFSTGVRDSFMKAFDSNEEAMRFMIDRFNEKLKTVINMANVIHMYKDDVCYSLCYEVGDCNNIITYQIAVV